MFPCTTVCVSLCVCVCVCVFHCLALVSVSMRVGERAILAALLCSWAAKYLSPRLRLPSLSSLSQYGQHLQKQCKHILTYTYKYTHTHTHTKDAQRNTLSSVVYTGYDSFISPITLSHSLSGVFLHCTSFSLCLCIYLLTCINADVPL